MVRMIAGMLIAETLISGTDLGRYAADPTPTAVGDGYYNTTFNCYKYWNGTAWVTEPITVVVNPTVTWNPSASPLSVVLKDWNRGFEKGDLTEWTPTNAEISTVQPHTGSYCCKLKATGSKIVQTLNDPVPVNGIWLFRFRARSAVGTKALEVHMLHTDGTSAEGGVTVFASTWRTFYFSRESMYPEKILSGIEFESVGGEIFIDDVFLGLATEIVTGSVETSQATPMNLQGEMMARPKGGVLETGSVTTTAAYQTVVEYTPLEDYKLELAKILVSCPNDVMYRLRWGAVVISAEVYVTGGIPFTDWFPWDYYNMRGDGTSTFNIQVMYPAGGAAAVCHAEIVGEYVPWAFNT